MIQGADVLAVEGGELLVSPLPGAVALAERAGKSRRTGGAGRAAGGWVLSPGSWLLTLPGPLLEPECG